jgi:hypothetical protein
MAQLRAVTPSQILLVLIAILLGLILAAVTLTYQLAVHLGVRLGNLEIADAFADSIVHFAETHPAAPGVAPEETLSAWLASGLVSFTASFAGVRGGRVAWCIFGTLTCGMAYTGAAPPCHWTMAGISALAWSGLSLFALRRVERRPQNFRERKVTEEEKLDEIEPASTRAARRRNFASLDEYFAERGNQTIDVITEELALKKRSLTAPLRLRYLGPEISTKSKLKPGVQRNVIADIRSRQFTDIEIRERNKCSADALRRMQSTLQRAESNHEK